MNAWKNQVNVDEIISNLLKSSQCTVGDILCQFLTSRKSLINSIDKMNLELK
jgi:hypothetical protein